jgi:hypothetical protein
MDESYNTGKGPQVVMKMDIESQEYAVLPDVMFSGTLCKTGLLNMMRIDRQREEV